MNLASEVGTVDRLSSSWKVGRVMSLMISIR